MDVALSRGPFLFPFVHNFFVCTDRRLRVSANEEWKDVVGYEGIYQVSNKGHIKRMTRGPGTHPGKLLKLSESSTGYLIVSLCKNGNCRTALVHRLVAQAFLGCAPSPSHQVNHKNGIRNDNCTQNLEWATPTENNRHAVQTLNKRLSYSKGEDRYNAKLSRNDVREIRRLYATGKYTQAQIAKMFQVTDSCIWRVVHGKTWQHVGGPIAHNGGITLGETHYGAKLARKDVAKIRQLYATGHHTQAALARMFSVSTGCVFDIVHHKTWKHISLFLLFAS